MISLAPGMTDVNRSGDIDHHAANCVACKADFVVSCIALG
jgi:hypothetical protein